MLNFTQFSGEIEEALNKLVEEADNSNLNGLRDRYRFRIRTDAANYAKAERNGNTVTRYINGMLNIVESNLETTNGGKINATVSMILELAVPVVDDQDENGNLELVKTVRDLLNAHFSSNTFGSVVGTSGEAYNYGSQYSIPTCGERGVHPLLGDGVLFVVTLDYYFIESGINSRSIQLYIDGNRVEYELFGMRRTASTEPYVGAVVTTSPENAPYNADAHSAKTLSSFTVFSICFDAPALLDATGQMATDYLMNGEANKGHLVTIIRPKRIKETQDGTDTYTTKNTEYNYIMAFTDVGNNAQNVLNASSSVTMAEVPVNNGIIELSAAASAFLTTHTSGLLEKKE